MGMQIPDELANLFYGLTGTQWPKVDEDRLRDFSDAYATAEYILATELPDLVLVLRRKVQSTFDSRTTEYFENSLAQFTAGERNYIGEAAELAGEIRQYAKDAANQVEYAKWMIIGQLIQLALEIAWAIATAKFTFGASLKMIPLFRFITNQVIRRILNWLVWNLLSHLFVAQLFGVTMDLLIQRIQMDQGNRDGWDKELTRMAAAGAFVEGLLSAGLSFGADLFLSGQLAKLFSKNLPDPPAPPPPPVRDLLGDPPAGPPGRGAGPDAFTPPPRDVPDTFASPPPRDTPGPDPTPPPRDPPGGGSGGGPGGGPGAPPVRVPPPPGSITPEFNRDLVNLFARNSNEFLNPAQRPNTTSQGAGHAGRFVDGSGDVFARHFGDTLGEAAARGLGRNYAETLLRTWNTPRLNSALDDVLGSAPLPQSTRDHLARDVPDAFGRTVADFGNRWRDRATALGIGAASGAFEGYVGEGLTNLWFSPEQKWEASGMSAVAGASSSVVHDLAVTGGLKGLDSLSDLRGINDRPTPDFDTTGSSGSGSSESGSSESGSSGSGSDDGSSDVSSQEEARPPRRDGGSAFESEDAPVLRLRGGGGDSTSSFESYDGDGDVSTLAPSERPDSEAGEDSGAAEDNEGGGTRQDGESENGGAREGGGTREDSGSEGGGTREDGSRSGQDSVPRPGAGEVPGQQNPGAPRTGQVPDTDGRGGEGPASRSDGAVGSGEADRGQPAGPPSPVPEPEGSSPVEASGGGRAGGAEPTPPVTVVEPSAAGPDTGGDRSVQAPPEGRERSEEAVPTFGTNAEEAGPRVSPSSGDGEAGPRLSPGSGGEGAGTRSPETPAGGIDLGEFFRSLNGDAAGTGSEGAPVPPPVVAGPVPPPSVPPASPSSNAPGAVSSSSGRAEGTGSGPSRDGGHGEARPGGSEGAVAEGVPAPEVSPVSEGGPSLTETGPASWDAEHASDEVRAPRTESAPAPPAPVPAEPVPEPPSPGDRGPEEDTSFQGTPPAGQEGGPVPPSGEDAEPPGPDPEPENGLAGHGEGPAARDEDSRGGEQREVPDADRAGDADGVEESSTGVGSVTADATDGSAPLIREDPGADGDESPDTGSAPPASNESAEAAVPDGPVAGAAPPAEPSHRRSGAETETPRSPKPGGGRDPLQGPTDRGRDRNLPQGSEDAADTSGLTGEPDPRTPPGTESASEEGPAAFESESADPRDERGGLADPAAETPESGPEGREATEPEGREPEGKEPEGKEPEAGESAKRAPQDPEPAVNGPAPEGPEAEQPAKETPGSEEKAPGSEDPKGEEHRSEEPQVRHPQGEAVKDESIESEEPAAERTETAETRENTAGNTDPGGESSGDPAPGTGETPQGTEALQHTPQAPVPVQGPPDPAPAPPAGPSRTEGDPDALRLNYLIESRWVESYGVRVDPDPVLDTFPGLPDDVRVFLGHGLSTDPRDFFSADGVRRASSDGRTYELRLSSEDAWHSGGRDRPGAAKAKYKGLHDEQTQTSKGESGLSGKARRPVVGFQANLFGVEAIPAPAVGGRVSAFGGSAVQQQSGDTSHTQLLTTEMTGEGQTYSSDLTVTWRVEEGPPPASPAPEADGGAGRDSSENPPPAAAATEGADGIELPTRRNPPPDPPATEGGDGTARSAPRTPPPPTRLEGGVELVLMGGVQHRDDLPARITFTDLWGSPAAPAPPSDGNGPDHGGTNRDGTNRDGTNRGDRRHGGYLANSHPIAIDSVTRRASDGTDGAGSGGSGPEGGGTPRPQDGGAPTALNSWLADRLGFDPPGTGSNTRRVLHRTRGDGDAPAVVSQPKTGSRAQQRELDRRGVMEVFSDDILMTQLPTMTSEPRTVSVPDAGGGSRLVTLWSYPVSMDLVPDIPKNFNIKLTDRLTRGSGLLSNRLKGFFAAVSAGVVSRLPGDAFRVESPSFEARFQKVWTRGRGRSDNAWDSHLFHSTDTAVYRTRRTTAVWLDNDTEPTLFDVSATEALTADDVRRLAGGRPAAEPVERTGDPFLDREGGPTHLGDSLVRDVTHADGTEVRAPDGDPARPFFRDYAHQLLTEIDRQYPGLVLPHLALPGAPAPARSHAGWNHRRNRDQARQNTETLLSKVNAASFRADPDAWLSGQMEIKLVETKVLPWLNEFRERRVGVHDHISVWPRARITGYSEAEPLPKSHTGTTTGSSSGMNRQAGKVTSVTAEGRFGFTARGISGGLDSFGHPSQAGGVYARAANEFRSRQRSEHGMSSTSETNVKDKSGSRRLFADAEFSAWFGPKDGLVPRSSRFEAPSRTGLGREAFGDVRGERPPPRARVELHAPQVGRRVPLDTPPAEAPGPPRKLPAPTASDLFGRGPDGFVTTDPRTVRVHRSTPNGLETVTEVPEPQEPAPRPGNANPPPTSTGNPPLADTAGGTVADSTNPPRTVGGDRPPLADTNPPGADTNPPVADTNPPGSVGGDPPTTADAPPRTDTTGDGAGTTGTTTGGQEGARPRTTGNGTTGSDRRADEAAPPPLAIRRTPRAELLSDTFGTVQAFNPAVFRRGEHVITVGSLTYGALDRDHWAFSRSVASRDGSAAVIAAHTSSQTLAASAGLTQSTGDRFRVQLDDGIAPSRTRPTTVTWYVPTHVVSAALRELAVMEPNRVREISFGDGLSHESAFTVSIAARGAFNPQPTAETPAQAPRGTVGPLVQPGLEARYTPHGHGRSESSSVSYRTRREVKFTGATFEFVTNGVILQATEHKKDFDFLFSVPRSTKQGDYSAWYAPVTDAQKMMVPALWVFSQGLVPDRLTWRPDGGVELGTQPPPQSPPAGLGTKPDLTGKGFDSRPARAPSLVDDLERQLNRDGWGLTVHSREDLIKEVSEHVNSGRSGTELRVKAVETRLNPLGPNPRVKDRSRVARLTLDIERGPARVDQFGGQMEYVDRNIKATSLSQSNTTIRGHGIGGAVDLLAPIGNKEDPATGRQTGAVSAGGTPAFRQQSVTEDSSSAGTAREETQERVLFSPYAKVTTPTRVTAHLSFGDQVYTATADDTAQESVYPLPFLEPQAPAGAAPRSGPHYEPVGTGLDGSSYADTWARSRKGPDGSGFQDGEGGLSAIPLAIEGEAKVLLDAAVVNAALVSGWKSPNDRLDLDDAEVVSATRYLDQRISDIERAAGITARKDETLLLALTPDATREPTVLAEFGGTVVRTRALLDTGSATIEGVSNDSRARDSDQEGGRQSHTRAEQRANNLGLGGQATETGRPADRVREAAEAESAALSGARGGSSAGQRHGAVATGPGTKRMFLVRVPARWLVWAESTDGTTPPRGGQADSSVLRWIDADQARSWGLATDSPAIERYAKAEAAFTKADAAYFKARGELFSFVGRIDEPGTGGADLQQRYQELEDAYHDVERARNSTMRDLVDALRDLRETRSPAEPQPLAVPRTESEGEPPHGGEPAPRPPEQSLHEGPPASEGTAGTERSAPDTGQPPPTASSASPTNPAGPANPAEEGDRSEGLTTGGPPQPMPETGALFDDTDIYDATPPASPRPQPVHDPSPALLNSPESAGPDPTDTGLTRELPGTDSEAAPPEAAPPRPPTPEAAPPRPPTPEAAPPEAPKPVAPAPEETTGHGGPSAPRPGAAPTTEAGPPWPAPDPRATETAGESTGTGGRGAPGTPPPPIRETVGPDGSDAFARDRGPADEPVASPSHGLGRRDSRGVLRFPSETDVVGYGDLLHDPGFNTNTYDALPPRTRRYVDAYTAEGWVAEFSRLQPLDEATVQAELDRRRQESAAQPGWILYEINGGRWPTLETLPQLLDSNRLTPEQEAVVRSVVEAPHPDSALEDLRNRAGSAGLIADTLRDKRGRGSYPDAQDVLNVIEHLDRATGRSLPEGVETVRGVFGFEHLAPGATLDPSSLVGRTYTDPGYMSVSLGGRPGAVGGSPTDLIRFSLPPGTQGLWVGDRSLHPSEREIILARGTSYRILSVEPWGRGYVLHAEVLPAGHAPRSPSDTGAGSTGEPGPGEGSGRSRQEELNTVFSDALSPPPPP